MHHISWYVYTIFSLSNPPFIGIQVGSTYLLLWIVPWWRYGCMCLYNRMIYNPLGVYPVMGWLGRMIFLDLDPWGITTLSSTMVELIYPPNNSIKAFLFLYILFSICCLLIFLTITFLTGMKWYLNVVLICISLMTSDDELFSYVCWLHKCLLLRSVCSYPSPTFWWYHLFLSCTFV